MSAQASRPDVSGQYAALGPIGGLVADPEVSEVIVVGARDVYVEVRGKLELTDISFSDEEELMDVIREIVEAAGRHIDAENPLCDARLPDGSRVHAAIPPVAIDG